MAPFPPPPPPAAGWLPATKVKIIANARSENKTGNIGEKSLKTDRTYQVGIVYKDIYGRETPVFTNSEASFSIDKTLADQKNSIITNLENITPQWVDTYKFFVKETSNEYYNVCMDRWYDSEDENIWLSFPSAERNKIQEDAFIILKKKADEDGNLAAVKEDAKYKVIDISNEAPDDIKTDYELYGNATLEVLNTTAIPGSSNIQFDWTAGGTPWDTSVFYDALLAGTAPTVSANQPYLGTGISDTGFIGWPLEDVVIKLSKEDGENTGWLDVANIYKETELHVQLSKPFSGGESSDGSSAIENILPLGLGDVTVKLAKRVVKKKPEFDGRFFVKIRRDGVVDENIRSVGNPSPNFVIKDTMPQYYLNYGSHDFATLCYNTNIGQVWYIDDCSRGNVGGGGGSNPPTHGGSSGPYPEDYGYGMRGDGSFGSSPRSGSAKESLRCTMELNFHYVKDGSDMGFSTSDNSSADKDFLALMSTKGTMFRWKEDPYQHIYKIETVYNSQDGNTNGRGILNFSTQSWAKESYRNKDIRLYLKFQTTGWRLNDDQGGTTAGTYQFYVNEKDKYPFFYKNTSSAGYTPSGYSTDATTNAYSPWNPTRKGYGTYGGSSAAHQVNSAGTYNSIEQSGSSFTSSLWSSNTIEIMEISDGESNPIYTKNPAIWETEPREDVGLDIYHEASQAYPVKLTNKTNELFAPYGCTVTCADAIDNKSLYLPSSSDEDASESGQATSGSNTLILDAVNNNIIVGMRVQGAGLSTSIRYTVTNVSGTTITMSDNATSTSSASATFSFTSHNTILYDWAPTGHGGDTILLSAKVNQVGIINNNAVSSATNPKLITPGSTVMHELNPVTSGGVTDPGLTGLELQFTRLDGSYTTARIRYFSGYASTNQYIDGTHPSYPGTGNEYMLIKLDRDLTNSKIKLPYFNCYTFGNGVESNRIRDDFNAITLGKGVKASTVLPGPYQEEQRTNGLIYSGIYNSNSNLNNLNQFIGAEKITKDVPPSYGSIQKLKARDTNLVAFCEDKILKIQAYKDALYKADGNPDVISTNKVLGDISSFAGEFGISTNPESYAEDSFRMYCTDKQRGKVLRISGDGITPISEVGMQDYFANNLKENDTLLGTFDDRKQEYNLTLKNQQKTLSFSEAVKGWTSFKSFIPESGLSINNNYYTFKNGKLWQHHINETRNNFYGDDYNSHVDILFNEESATVKSFASMKYEGTQSKITQNLGSTVNGVFYPDNEYHNNIGKPGWYVESGITDLQEAGEMEFKNKEGKWFSYMKGKSVTGVSDLDSKEFSFQGIDLLRSRVDGISNGISCYRCSDEVLEVSTTNSTFSDGGWVCPEGWTTGIPDNCGEEGFDCGAQNIQFTATPSYDTIEVHATSSSDDMPYLFSLVGADGITYNNTGGSNPLSYGGGSTIFGNLPSQQYTVTATSQNLCQATQSVTINIDTLGCTDSTAINYDPTATVDDGSCIVCSTLNINYTITPHSMANLSNGIKVLLHNTGDDLPYTVACLDGQGNIIGDSSGAFGWSSGGTTAQGDIVYFGQGTPLITGTYTIIITTAHGCTSQDIIFIDNGVLPTSTGFQITVQDIGDEDILEYHEWVSCKNGNIVNIVETGSSQSAAETSNFHVGVLQPNIGQVIGVDAAPGMQGSECYEYLGINSNTAINGFISRDGSSAVAYSDCAQCEGVYGCTDPAATNYNPLATMNDGSCVYLIYGCTDSTAPNYNPSATIDDGSCICAWQQLGLSGGGPVTFTTVATNYTNSLGGQVDVYVSLTQPDGPYEVELVDPNGNLYANTFGTTTHQTTLGFGATVSYTNMPAGMYIARARDVNGCEVWMGMLMN